jgi:hypothetical protein
MHSPVADRPFGQLAPLHVLRGALGWRIRLSRIIFADPVFLVIQATPVFPGCAPPGANPDAVWDLAELLKSVRRPGACELFTCTCGDAPDAGIDGAVHVSHPDPHTVVWEMDVREMREVLDPILASEPEGFLRWVFDRADYEAGIRRFIRDFQQAARRSWPVHELPEDVEGIFWLHQDHPQLDALPVQMLEPDGTGLGLKELLTLDPDAVWTPEPLFPAGTRIEVGFFPDGDHDCLVRIDEDGKQTLGWRDRGHTRREVELRFRDWMRQVDWAANHPGKLPGVSRYRHVLRSEADRAPCHAAGRAFTEALAASLREGDTAPGVEVRYVERALFCVE